MDIQLVDELSEENSDHLFHWRERVFPSEGKGIEWAKPKWHLLAFENKNKPSAHLGYADFTILIDAEVEENVIGIGGVVVRPEDQGKHIPAKLFEFLHSSQHAKKLASLFILFCPKRLESYYQKHGYSTFNGSFTFLQNGVTASTDLFCLMYFGDSLPATKIHINGEIW